MGAQSVAKFRVLGVNDDASDCLCCGKSGLKRVVWMQPLDREGNDDGQPVHFGTVCASKAAGWGYGSDANRAEQRILREELESRKHYGKLCSDKLQSMIRAGQLVASRVCFGFDWKSGAHHYGYIYTIPDDQIVNIADPMAQKAAIPDAKRRARDAFPILVILDENLNAAQLRALLA